jgi:hypothetical protein
MRPTLITAKRRTLFSVIAEPHSLSIGGTNPKLPGRVR